MATKDYSTKDLLLAAFLITKGYKFTVPPKFHNNNTWFSFEDTPALQAVILKYYNKEVQVNPIDFNSSMRFLHRIMDSLKEGGEQND
jgi:hypothetical protein